MFLRGNARKGKKSLALYVLGVRSPNLVLFTRRGKNSRNDGKRRARETESHAKKKVLEKAKKRGAKSEGNGESEILRDLNYLSFVTQGSVRLCA